MVTSGTFGDGNAGSVTVKAGELVISGEDGTAATGISSDAQAGSGDAGEVTVVADDILLTRGGRISSITFTEGRGGTVRIRAGELMIAREGVEAFTGITSQADMGAEGSAGSIDVEAGRLSIFGGQISSATLGSGDAGEVRIVSDWISIAGDGTGAFSGITSTARDRSLGRAGSVRVEATTLSMSSGAEISSNGFGSGPAGNVAVTAGRLESRNARIATRGTGVEGGAIEVLAERFVAFLDSEVTSNGIRPAAGASLITLGAPAIAIGSSRVESIVDDVPLQRRPGSGDFGSEETGAARLLGRTTIVSTDSIVAASFELEVTGLDTEIGSELSLPEAVPVAVDALLGNACIAALEESRSRFVRVGRGSLPAAPDRPLASTFGRPAPAGTSTALMACPKEVASTLPSRARAFPGRESDSGRHRRAVR